MEPTEQLQNEISSLRLEQKRSQAEIEQIMGKNKQLFEERNRLSKAFELLDNKALRMEQANGRLEKNLQGFQARENKYKGEIRDKEAIIEDLRKAVVKKDSEIIEQALATRKAQKSMFDMLAATQWSPEATSDIRRSLDRLYDKVKLWCKESL